MRKLTAALTALVLTTTVAAHAGTPPTTPAPKKPAEEVKLPKNPNDTVKDTVPPILRNPAPKL